MHVSSHLDRFATNVWTLLYVIRHDLMWLNTINREKCEPMATIDMRLLFGLADQVERFQRGLWGLQGRGGGGLKGFSGGLNIVEHIHSHVERNNSDARMVNMYPYVRCYGPFCIQHNSLNTIKIAHRVYRNIRIAMYKASTLTAKTAVSGINCHTTLRRL